MALTPSRDHARGRGRHSPSTPLVFKATSVVYNPPFQKFLDPPLINDKVMLCYVISRWYYTF